MTAPPIKNNNLSHQNIPIDYDGMKIKYLEEIKAHIGGNYRKGPYITSRDRMIKIIERVQKAKIKVSLGCTLTRAEKRVMRLYDIIEDQNEFKVIERETLSNGRVFIPPEDSFDIILENHSLEDHGSFSITKAAVEEQYLIYPKCYEILIRVCNVCQNMKTEKLQKPHKKPVKYNNRSFSLAQQPHQKKKVKKWYVFLNTVDTPADPPFRYIMIVKDLETQFTYLRPLTSLEVVEVAQELLKMSTDFGPPIILVSNHGDYLKDICYVLKTICPEYDIKAEQFELMPGYWLQQVETFLNEWIKVNNTVAWSLGCHIVQWQINNSDNSKVKTPHKVIFENNIPSTSSRVTFDLPKSEMLDINDFIRMDDEIQNDAASRQIVTISSINEPLPRLEYINYNKNPTKAPEVGNNVVKDTLEIMESYYVKNLVTLSTINKILPNLENDNYSKILACTPDVNYGIMEHSSKMTQDSFTKNMATERTINETLLRLEKNDHNKVLGTFDASNCVMGNTPKMTKNNYTKAIVVPDQTLPAGSQTNITVNSIDVLQDGNVRNTEAEEHLFPIETFISKFLGTKTTSENFGFETATASETFSLDDVIYKMRNSSKNSVKNNSTSSMISKQPYSLRTFDKRVINSETLAKDTNATSSLWRGSGTTLGSNNANSRAIVDKINLDVFDSTVSNKKGNEPKIEIFTSHNIEIRNSFQDSYAGVKNSTKSVSDSSDIISSEQDSQSLTAQQTISVESIISDFRATERALQDENARIMHVCVEFIDDENEDINMSNT